MKFCSEAIVLFLLLQGVLSEELKSNRENELTAKTTRTPRQMEYISLIGTLLQQTSVLSSVDGVLLAATTVVAAALARARPLLVAGFLSYLLYAGTALLVPGAAARMGIVPHRDARSATSTGGVVAEALMRSFQMNPIMSIITNVTVTVVTDAAARIRMFSRALGNQLRWVQSRMSVWSNALQNTCVERFLCQVGRFTQETFPAVAIALRTIG